MAQSKRKFYRTTITVTILSEEPYQYDNLLMVHNDITNGDCSGVHDITNSEELTAKQAVKALQKQASDPEFFGLTEDGEDLS